VHGDVERWNNKQGRQPLAATTRSTGGLVDGKNKTDGALHFANVVNLVGDSDVDAFDKIA
jgi:hypothetical protein